MDGKEGIRAEVGGGRVSGEGTRQRVGIWVYGKGIGTERQREGKDMWEWDCVERAVKE